MSTIQILPVNLDVLNEFKTTRLAALKDTPLAFGSTFARESTFTEDEWKSRIARGDGKLGVNFLAWENDKPCGIVAGFFEDESAGVVHLVSMWVAPSHRRRGVGVMLVNEVIGWARQQRADRVRLLVTEINHSAIQFYERIGFEKSGRTEVYPNDPNIVEYEMIHELNRA